ncbi:MAG: PaaI family thioesterase [Leptospira sp.]|nr:PaaI family thioesterase [Leptospira sp.]NCS94842.1 PaaI family thioesterase [Leptospira sp.]
MEIWKEVKNLPYKKCFGCGGANEIGLKMEFESNQKEIRSFTHIPEHLAGWSNLAHGGVLATILDETMAWAAIYLERSYILTKKISVEFIKPVFVGDNLEARGHILEKISAKEVLVYAEIKNANGVVVAKGEGNIALFTPESIRKFGFLEEDYLVDFEKVVLNQ